MNDGELFDGEMNWSREAFEKMKIDTCGAENAKILDLHDVDTSSMKVMNELLEEIIKSVGPDGGLAKIEIMDLEVVFDIQNYQLECLAKKAFRCQNLPLLALR